MRKNPSPGYIALLSALITTVIPVVILLIFQLDIWQTALIAIATFAGAFFISYYLLQIFIYRKIKLIFKVISRFKSQDDRIQELISKGDEDPLSAVSKEVYSWMLDNKRELDQLKEQANFRREFLGNVSHELKTPIFSIQGYIHTLLDGALEDKAVNRKFLKKASRSTDRLVELVQELTSISELQSGKFELDIKKFDIYELVREVYELLEDLADEKQIKLEFKKHSNKAVFVKGDRKKISQVITNLVVNAIKYGAREGVVLTGFYEMDKNLLIEISDDGEGIAAEHLPRLFERFYRVDRHRSREEGGSGLGLAIVKHIIEAHQQTINVRSTIGKGTTFGFTLPRA
ncbi:sensor histidine kinase [bacterium]|nr:sensor histidine kinase [bacterium]